MEQFVRTKEVTFAAGPVGALKPSDALKFHIGQISLDNQVGIIPTPFKDTVRVYHVMITGVVTGERSNVVNFLLKYVVKDAPLYGQRLKKAHDLIYTRDPEPTGLQQVLDAVHGGKPDTRRYEIAEEQAIDILHQFYEGPESFDETGQEIGGYLQTALMEVLLRLQYRDAEEFTKRLTERRPIVPERLAPLQPFEQEILTGGTETDNIVASIGSLIEAVQEGLVGNAILARRHLEEAVDRIERVVR